MMGLLIVDTFKEELYNVYMPFTKGHKINLGRKTGKTIFCQYCKKKIYKMPSEIKHGARFCSNSCRVKHIKPHLGKPHNQETKDKISKKLKEVTPKGEDHWEWKGDDVGYRALHNWVDKTLGNPKICVSCNNTKSNRYHWANISGEYLREEADWIRLCPKCHKAFDMGRRVMIH